MPCQKQCISIRARGMLDEIRSVERRGVVSADANPSVGNL